MLHHVSGRSIEGSSIRQRRAIRFLLGLANPPGRSRATTLAAATHYSASRLRAIARAALGEAPAARQRRLRLDAAACALMTCDQPITRLANLAGFRSVEGFHRAFRARFGCSPRAWVRAEPATRAARAHVIGRALARHLGSRTEPGHG